MFLKSDASASVTHGSPTFAINVSLLPYQSGAGGKGAGHSALTTLIGVAEHSSESVSQSTLLDPFDDDAVSRTISPKRRIGSPM